ncbi:carboxylesterase/lipase family protein [Aquabacterium sp.]|uniref:carboxylesterase/lipase family protein n=1 Tax=Aquabacterium sp. TaxID=1872578 RepID=UPI003782F5BF
MALRPGLGRLFLATLTACAAALGGCGGNGDAASPTLRDTAYGMVQGSELSTGTWAWKGLPYAKAPVGALRWKAPVEPDSWNGTIRPATQFGNACVQYGRIYGPGANNTYDATIGTTLNQAVGSEDCLYLNIWRPATGDDKLPVIVFIHGGSNVSGYTADPVYDGATLAKTANAVVVSVNYRLGIFGWLNLPQLKDGSSANDDSGNFATLDTIQALRFINRNIANFGGDPGNVTVTGQSAGAINVYALMTSPLMVNASPKLMHRAVAMSGGISLASNLPPGSLPTLNPATTALAQGNALLQQQLIADGLATDVASANAYIATQTKAQLAAYLRSKSPAALLGTLLGRLAALGLAGSGPIPEGTVLPVDPVASINAGNYLKVPFIASNTRDEAKLFPTFLALSPALGGVSGRLVSDATLFSNHFGYNPNAAPTTTVQQWIPTQYLPVTTPVTGFNARTDLLNTIFFIASRNNVMAALKAQQPASVWYYRFDWDEEPAPWNDIYGAAHAFDLPFMFGNFGPSLFSNVANSTANQAGRLALSDAMMKSLGAFARSGDPNTGALGVTWPTWPAQLLFDASATAKAITVQP